MKNLYVIISLAICQSLFVFDALSQPVNDLCSGAIPLIPSPDGTGCLTPTFTLPYATDGTTDSGLGLDCFGSRFGLDQFFTWTATANALRWNSESPGNPGIVVYENTNTPAVPSCGSEIDCGGTFTTNLLLSGWDIGDNLIFQIYDFEGSTSDIAFCIEEACLPPEFTLSIDNSNCVNDDYSIIVELSSTGDAPLVDISNDVNSSGFDDQGVGTYILTGFTGSGTNAFVTVGDDALTNCLSSKTIELPTGCPPTNDDCSGAVAIVVGPEGDCSNSAVFSFPNASNSGVGACNTSNGLSRPDVWFSFVVPASGHVKIIPDNVTGFTDLKIEVFDGSCGTLNSILCDPTLIGASPIIANRVPGETLFVRVWEEGTTTNDYFMCIFEINAIDANDECADAIPLNVSGVASCTTQTITIGHSSYSGEGICDDGFGDIANDTWYSFTVPPSGIVNIQTFLNSNPFMDMHLEVFSGTCGNLISESCGGNGTDDIHLTLFDLVPGSTAFIRIWEDFNDETGTIDICVKDQLPNPHNECATANLLNVNTNCTFVQMNNEDASFSGNGICEFEGGDNAVDVWAKFLAPTSGAVTISTQAGSITDLSVEVLTGTCGSLVSIACDDDTGPGGMNLVHVSGLTTNDTVYIRMWEAFGDRLGDFSICVEEVSATTVGNNDCSSATNLTLPSGLCSAPTLINSLGASESIEVGLCGSGYGGAQRDIWFKAVAPASGSFFVEIDEISASSLLIENIGLDIMTGNCGSLTSVACALSFFGSLSLPAEGLTPGEDVFIRIWGNGTEGELNLCVSTAASNDFCSNAIDIGLDVDCSNPTEGFTNVATASPEGTCTLNGGGGGEDVWFRFDGNQAIGKDVSFIVQEGSSTSFTPIIEVFSSGTGSCGDMTSLNCVTGSSVAVSVVENIQANQTIFIRVYESFNNNPGTFTICAVEQPVNDNCESASALEVQVGTCLTQTVGSNTNMSDSPEGTCTIDAGISAADSWFKTTIPASGNLVIETSAAPADGIFDTVIEVLLGSDCDSLVSLDCDDNDGPSSFSRVEILGGNPGDLVLIRVWESFNNSFGNFSICAFDPILNDECQDAIIVSIAANKNDCNYTTFSAEGASASSNISACPTQFDDDVWLSFVATAGELIIDIPEEDVVTELYNLPSCSNLGGQILACHRRFPMFVDGLVVGQNYFLRVASEGEAPNVLDEFSICIYEVTAPSNDECSSAFAVPMGCDTSICGTTVFATFSNDGICVNLDGSNNATDVWFEATVPPSGAILFTIKSFNSDPLGIEVYTGTSCTNKVSQQCFETSQVLNELFLDELVPGTTVFLRIWDVNVGFAEDGVFLEICAIDPEPANNACIDATMLETQPAPCYTPTEATNQGANPDGIGSCALGGGTMSAKDVWFQAIVPASGNIIIRTSEALSNSILNTVVEIFTGPDCNNLTSIACEDSGIIENFASVDISSEPAGTLLWIRVWEFDNDNLANFNICAIEPPVSSDECSTAAEIVVHPDFCIDPVVASFEGATHSGLGSCTQGFGGSRPDIWFRLVVPPSGNVNITTMRAAGLIFNNTAMEAFTGSCGSLTSIACNDNTTANDYAELNLTGLVPGSDLFIRIWNATLLPIGQGFFYLCAVEPSPSPPANDDCAGATLIPVQVGDCVDDFGGTDLNATDSSPLDGAPEDCDNNFNGKDIWFKIELPANYTTNQYFMEFQFANGSSVEFEMYKGSCGNLEYLECLTLPTRFVPLEFNIFIFTGLNTDDLIDDLAGVGLAPGDELFFRAWSIAPGPAIGGFCLRAANECISSLDSDLDGVCDEFDNCIDISNPDQFDTDLDNIGDACDNCPTIFNPDQLDSNNNGIGDACENNCPENQVYAANPIPAVTLVSSDISAGGTVLISSGETVLFDAGNSITLNAEFSVEQGADFTAQIGGCVPVSNLTGDTIVIE